MGLISKLTGHHSSSDTTATDSKNVGGHAQPSSLDNRTGTSGTTTTHGAAHTAPHAHTGSTTGHTSGTGGIGSASGTGVGHQGNDLYGDNRTTGEKVKDTVSGGQHSTSTGTHGYGDNRTTGEKVKDTVSGGQHNTGTHGTSGIGSTTGHGNDLYGDNRTTGEKVKDTVSGGQHNTGTHGYGDNRTTGEKVKDTVSGGQHSTSTGTHGYGDNRTTGEKVKDTVSGGQHNTGTHGTSGIGSTTGHGNDLYGDNRTTGEKVKDTVSGGQHNTGTHGTSGVGSTTSSSRSTEYDSRSTTGTHGTSGVGSTSGDSRTTGEKIKDTVTGGTRRKKHREPGYVRSGRSSSSSSSSSDDEKRRHGTTTTRTTSSSSRDVHHQDARLGELHLNEHDLSSAKGEHVVKHAAPVVAEHVHDKYVHIDKTRVEELREKTEVTQTVQPVYDEVKVGTTHERVDHGLEVHEHGHRGLDSSAEAELARKREQIAREYRSTHDEETRQTTMRPDVDVHQRVNVIEEVVPVIEKDIYRPHEIEHVKHEVHIHHEAPVVKSTTVANPISIHEYEKASGVKIHELHSSDHATRETLTTDHHSHGSGGISGHSHSHGTSGISGRDGTSSSSYESHSTTGTHGSTTGDNRGIGQKIKDAVVGSSSSNSSQSYDNTRSTGSGIGSSTEHHTTGTQGVGHQGTEGYGDNRTTQGYDNSRDTGSASTGHHSSGTHGAGQGYGDNRTTGEKVKDTVTGGQHNTGSQGFQGGHVLPGSNTDTRR